MSGDGRWIEATTLHWGDEPWVVWETATGKIVSGNIPGPSGKSAFWSDWLIVQRGDDVSVWDLPSRARVFQRTLERGKYTAIAAVPQANQIVVGFDDGRMELWDWSTEPLVRRLPGHTDAVTAVASGPERVISASRPGEVHISELSTLSVVQKFQAELPVTLCLVRPGGREAIVLERSGRIYRIELFPVDSEFSG